MAQAATTDPSVENIRHQMEETKWHLAGQVEVLEHEVMDMVQDAHRGRFRDNQERERIGC